MSYRALAAATNHPDFLNPYAGLFNARSLEAFTDRDVDVDVVSPRPFAPPAGPYSTYRKIPRVSTHDGYDVHHPRFFYGIPKRLLYGVSGNSYAKRVPRYVERTFDTPDVVHAYHVYLDGYGLMEYCRERDIPLFAVAHGAFLNGYDDLRPSVREHVTETMAFCERLLCVSEALAKRASDLVPEANTTVLPIGADPDRFPTDQDGRIRAELGIPEDVPVVLFCGQYIERKGVNEIIETLPSLVETDAHFVFVGQDGDLRVPLRKAILEAGLTDCASVLYDVHSLTLRRLFAIADLLMLPSHDEGRPTVIYEAMASRTAVLATDVGGVSEQVDDGETGRIIQPGDADALAQAVRTLVDDPAAVDRFGDSGLERLREKGWMWDAHAERLRELHLEAIR